MIAPAWDEYRGWAARARQAQRSLRNWNRTSLGLTAAAAVLAGLAVELAGRVGWAEWAPQAAAAAAVAAALAPVVGREMLSSAVETRWLKARALAEAIKSECYRVVAGLPPYDGEDMTEAFVEWRATLSNSASQDGLTPLANPAPPEGDRRQPPAGFDADWYIEHRLRDQKRFYAARQVENERIAAWLRRTNLAASFVAAGLAALGAAREVTVWPSVFVALAAAVAAVGLLEKRHSLAAQYAAMALALGRIEEWYRAKPRDLKALVDRTEDLLTAEHAAWSRTMARFHSPPTAAESRA